MKTLHDLSRIIAATGLLAIVLSVSLQAQQTNEEYQPQVGQAGKDVVWVPTPQVLVDKMLEIANVTSQDYVMDLGSGDGRTVITAARLGATAVGVEYNPDMVGLSRRNAAEAGVTGKAQFIQGDLFEADLSKATVITLFLLPDINLRLRPKLLDLKPGTRVVSNTFTMQDWEPDERFRVEECSSWCTALMWIVPAKVDGLWRLSNGEIVFTQEFQMVNGNLTTGGKVTPITDGKLKGDEITFTADGNFYTGKVNGNSISGTYISGTSTMNWSATKTGP